MPATKVSGHFLWLFDFYFVTLPPKTIENITGMNRKLTIVLLTALTVATGCKEKKQTQDIIAPRIEVAKPSGPVRMQPYSDQRSIAWLGKEYKVEVQRTADDSLRKVKDETGQTFVDNRVSIVIRRADGSVAISKTFTKNNFMAYIDANYREAGILEGLVFDEVDDQKLKFAASVSLPLTDEYIPLEVSIDNFGQVTIKRDSEMDTYGGGDGSTANDDDDDDDDV